VLRRNVRRTRGTSQKVASSHRRESTTSVQRAAMAEQQAAAISPDGKTIATIAAARLTLHAGDGRTPPRQYVPARNGAAKRYGSVCWAPDASLVACGAADGSVTVWDVRKGTIRTTLPGTDPVKTVRFAADGGSVWVSTATADGAPRRTVRRLALNGETSEIDADARGVSTLAPHPSSGDACAVASSRIRLVKGTERRTLSGAHATFVSCLAWTKDGRRLASSADAREVLVHDCVSNSSETLRCAAPLLSLACFVRSDVVVCAAVLKDGRVQLAGSEPDSTRTAVAVRHVSGDALVVARGDPPKCSPEKLKIEGDRVAGLVPAKAPAPAPEKPSKKKAKAPPVLGFANLSGDPLLEEARQQHAAKRQRLEASESGDASLGDRLAEMDALARRHEAGLRADAAARDAGDAQRWGGPAAEGDAASLAKVLDQAARCGDDRLMDTVLRRGEMDVVEATLSRLPAASALPLLNNLAERLERRPRDAPRLVPWIQATLRHHAAHLANHPGARDALSRLQHVVAERVHLLPKLLALQGKFDLLLKRAAAARAAPAGGPAVEAVPLREVAADPSDDEMADDDDDEEEEDSSSSSSSSGSGDGGESSSGSDSDDSD